MAARHIGLLVGAAALLASIFLPTPAGMQREAFIVAGLVVLMAAWWMTEALPLTATALIFALFLTNPAPICVLDEVDAPLDDANIDRFCDLLDAMSRETQTRYLIVTHNAVTMSRMHRLFGVTMIEKGVSRLVSVDLGGAEELLAAE